MAEPAVRPRRVVAGCLLAVCCALASVRPALAKEAVPVAADAQLEARTMALAAELRCLVCQNQTIADSHADLAVDLRRQIRDLLGQGRSDAQVRDYMTARYGDFVLYKPPFKPTTAVLWLGPPLLLGAALAGLLLTLRARQRASPEAFEPDLPDDDADDAHRDANDRRHAG